MKRLLRSKTSKEAKKIPSKNVMGPQEMSIVSEVIKNVVEEVENEVVKEEAETTKTLEVIGKRKMKKRRGRSIQTMTHGTMTVKYRTETQEIDLLEMTKKLEVDEVEVEAEAVQTKVVAVEAEEEALLTKAGVVVEV